MCELEIHAVPKNLYYHEAAYVRGLEARAEKAECERDEASVRASLIDEAQDANAGLARLLAERDVKLATLRALIARAAGGLDVFEAESSNYDHHRQGSILIELPIYLRDIRRLAALAAELRKAGDGA